MPRIVITVFLIFFPFFVTKLFFCPLVVYYKCILNDPVYHTGLSCWLSSVCCFKFNCYTAIYFLNGSLDKSNRKKVIHFYLGNWHSIYKLLEPNKCQLFHPVWLLPDLNQDSIFVESLQITLETDKNYKNLATWFIFKLKTRIQLHHENGGLGAFFTCNFIFTF